MNSSPAPQEAPFRRFAATLLAAAAVRALLLLLLREQLGEDRDAYMQLAKTWAETGSYSLHLANDGTAAPTAYRAPLYPLLIGCLLLSGQDPRICVAGLHFVLGLATSALVWKTAEQLGLRRHAAFACLLVACDPILLAHSTLVMSETTAALLASASFYFLVAATRRSLPSLFALAGATLGLAALCRPIFVPVTAAVSIALAAGLGLHPSGDHQTRCARQENTPPTSNGRRPRFFALVLLTAAIVVYSPWILRNTSVFARPVITTSHGGYTLHLGNNASFFAYLRQKPWSSVWRGEGEIAGQADDFAAKHLVSVDWPERELWLVRFHYGEAFHAIRREPGLFARACLFRVASLWQLCPRAVDSPETTADRLARYGVGLWYGLFFVMSFCGIWKLRTTVLASAWLWVFLYSTVFTAVHVFYWSNMRMRAPLMPLLAPLAAAGLAGATERFRAIQRTTS